MTAELLLFYVFSAVLVACAFMVIVSRNAVHSALFLVAAFVTTAALWLLLQAEFLALILIVVYVGAVMTLFLFVVMMLNLEVDPKRKSFVRYLPIAAMVVAILLGIMWYVLADDYFQVTRDVISSTDYSNTRELGLVLYTDYVLPFELAGVLLLVAMVAAISLSFRGRRKGTRAQRVGEQVQVKKADRLRIVKMRSGE